MTGRIFSVMNIVTIDQCIGNTPLVRLQRLHGGSSQILCKLEGDNPAGSVKDRPAFQMIAAAEERGRIKPGDTLIEATSGNTGIALAMVAAVRGYRLILVMPEHMSLERRALMKAYGAEVILTPRDGGMEAAIDRVRAMEAAREGVVLDQFSNPDNPDAHYRTTGPEIWRDTDGSVTHFVASTGTTGTIMGTSRYLKERSPAVTIVGVRPDEEGGIPGIRAWPREYLPAIYDESRIDVRHEVSRAAALETMRELAAREGIFAGVSSGGNVTVALRVAREVESRGITDAVIVAIICDRGDRYISTGVFPG
jgi:S-sulfo-L-cysteine synthase (O-acetyl-L-serine-dependent)